MEENSQQMVEDDSPPTPIFGFVKASKKIKKDTKEADENTKAHESNVPDSSKQSEEGKDNFLNDEPSNQLKVPTVEKKSKKAAASKNNSYTSKHYVYLSTEARQSVQEALNELAHIRKKNQHEIRTIKLFIDQSLRLWKKSPKSKLEYNESNASRFQQLLDDPFKKFNNVVEELLKQDIKDICHEREKIGHPVCTQIAILDEAFVLWLPLQEDLPQEYLDSVLQSQQELVD